MSELTEDQNLIVETARSFAQERLRPNAARWEEEGLSRAVLRELGALGFAGIYVREDVGGSGLTRLDAALIFEELSRGCIATAAFLSIHNMCSWMIDAFGSEEQRAQWLPKLTRMEQIASYCLTEPGSGSDAGAMRTTAKADGNAHYVVNGSKAFISGAGFSDLYVLMCRTGEDGPKGVSTVLVKSGAPGLSFGKAEDKMGWRAQPTAIVNFEDCRIPAEDRIGPEGEGFKYAMKGLDGGRLNIAACALGGATPGRKKYWPAKRKMAALISQSTKPIAMARMIIVLAPRPNRFAVYAFSISREMITRMISFVPSRMRCTRRSRTIRSTS